MVKTIRKSYFGVFMVVAAMVLLRVLAGSSGATVGDTTRVSVDSSGTQANGISYGGPPTISSDGRYVAFSSLASNLVAGDTNGVRDVFVRDRTTPHTNDCIAPTTTASATTGSGAEYISGTPTNKNVTMSLSAQDNEGGSGIDNIRYSATGADAISEQTVAAADMPATFTIDAEGTTTVSYFATDNAGNQESPAKTLTVKIDKTAPSISFWTPTGKGVARSASTWAYFSERVDPDSITTSTFKLYRCSSTTSTDCPTQITNRTLTKNPEGLSAILDPFGSNTTTLLAKYTRYKVMVTTGVRDEAGNRLDQNATTTGNQNKAWYFTTGRV